MLIKYARILFVMSAQNKRQAKSGLKQGSTSNGDPQRSRVGQKTAVKQQPVKTIVLATPKTIPSVTTRRRNPNRKRVVTYTPKQEAEWNAAFKKYNPNAVKKEKVPKTKKAEKRDWWQDILDFGKQLLPHALPLLMGAGDYEQDLIVEGERPTTNSLLAAATNGQQGSQVPVMHESGNVVRVTHREYIGDVYSSTSAFSLVTFSINPGLAATFPWLSPIANQFTGWRPLGLVAEFVSEGSDYANVAGLGYVALASNYNALAPAYTSKRELLNSQFATAAKPSITFQHWIECKDENIPQEKLYVRSGAVSSGDLRLYDLSTLHLAVGGNTASGAILGELWLTYDIALMLPKATESVFPTSKFYFGQATNASNSSMFATVSSFAGTTFVPTFATNTITFPANATGYFYVVLKITSYSALAFAQPSLTFGGGASQFGSVYGTASSTTTEHWQLVGVFLNGTGGTLTYSAASMMNPPGTILIWIFQRPPPTSTSEIFDPLGLNYEDNITKLLQSLQDSSDEWQDFMQTPTFLLQEDKKHNFRCLSKEYPDVGLIPIPGEVMAFLDKLSVGEKDKFLAHYVAQKREDEKSLH